MAGTDNISKRITIYINGKEVENSVKAIRAEYTKLNNSINNTTLETEEYEQKVEELKKAKAILDDHTAKIRGVGGAWDKSKTSAGGAFEVMQGVLGADLASNLAQGVVDAGKKLFNLGTQMELLTAKSQTVFREALPQVTAEAEENAAAMGLTTSQYTNAATAIGDLLIPMQFQRSEAAGISTELVNVSGALAEWTGGQRTSEEVTSILSKAMLGEREELKSLGISIQEADVQARLHDKGLKDLTGTYLQQAKAVATLELIMEKSQDAQTAFANNQGSNLRLQAEATARIQSAWEKVSVALIPVFTRLSEMALSFANAVGNIGAGIASIINPAQAATDEFRKQEATVSDLNDNFMPLLARHDELASKSELTTSEQDELRKIIIKVGEVVPQAIVEFNEYGEALVINTDRARDFVEQQKAILQVKNEEAINKQQRSLKNLEEEYGRLSGTLNGTGQSYQNITKRGEDFFRVLEKGGLNARVEFQKLTEGEVADLFNRLGDLQKRISGTRGILGELTGTTLEQNVDDEKAKAAQEAAQEAALLAAAESEKRREAAKKAADKEIKDLESKQKKLLEFIRKGNDDMRITDLDENAAAIERIKLKYQEQINVTIELEKRGYKDAAANRAALERLRDAEVDQYNEARLKKLQEASRKLAEYLNLSNLESYQKDLAQIQTKYAEQIKVAQELVTSGVAGAQAELVALQSGLAKELETARSQYIKDAMEDSSKLSEAYRNSQNSQIQVDINAISTRYDTRIAELRKAEQDEANFTEAERARLHLVRLEMERFRQEEIDMVKSDALKAGTDKINAYLRSEQENAIFLLQTQYEELLKIAKDLGLDTVALEQEFANKRIAITNKETQTRLASYASLYTSLGDAFVSFADLIADEESEYLGFQKVAALAQIAFDTAAAISSLTANSQANPANAVTFGGAGAAQFISGLAQIFANIAKAKKLLSEPIPQKYMGGYNIAEAKKQKASGEAVGDYFSVVGAEDSKRYEAQYIGAQSTGMLPGKPSLVLASEKGAEYFVSNEDLQKPAVANYVRIIENIRTNRVPQRAEGGYANPSGDAASPGSPSMDPESMKMISEIRNFLSILINQGVRATTVLDDDTIVRTNQRFEEINNISGGVIKS